MVVYISIKTHGTVLRRECLRLKDGDIEIRDYELLSEILQLWLERREFCRCRLLVKGRGGLEVVLGSPTKRGQTRWTELGKCLIEDGALGEIERDR